MILILRTTLTLFKPFSFVSHGYGSGFWSCHVVFAVRFFLLLLLVVSNQKGLINSQHDSWSTTFVDERGKLVRPTCVAVDKLALLQPGHLSYTLYGHNGYCVRIACTTFVLSCSAGKPTWLAGMVRPLSCC